MLSFADSNMQKRRIEQHEKNTCADSDILCGSGAGRLRPYRRSGRHRGSDSSPNTGADDSTDTNPNDGANDSADTDPDGGPHDRPGNPGARN